MALIFAIGVALGLSKNDGVAALAATIGYLVMNGTLGVVATARGVETSQSSARTRSTPASSAASSSASSPAYMFNRFYRIQLPQYLGLLRRQAVRPDRHGLRRDRPRHRAGLRLAAHRRPHQQRRQRDPEGEHAGRGVRLRHRRALALLPFGLHHIWNAPFFFTLNVGGWDDCAGILTCFFAGHPESGILGGGFLFKMFGLSGAALAIYRTAKPENRARIGLDHVPRVP